MNYTIKGNKIVFGNIVFNLEKRTVKHKKVKKATLRERLRVANRT